MRYRTLHPWDVSPSRAIQIQRELRDQLILKGDLEIPSYIAGADVSYSKKTDQFYAAVVVFKFSREGLFGEANLTKVDEATHIGRVSFPYIPGLLSFREAQPLLCAFEKLKIDPHLVIFDANGIAHPRGFGSASHIGLLLNIPSIGCAKSRLVGEYEPIDDRPGSYSHLIYEDRIVGAVLRTKARTNPIFVSQGHKISLESAIQITMECCMGYRVPEPTRIADQLTVAVRMKMEG